MGQSIFNDPVVAPTGITYNRTSLEDHLMVIPDIKQSSIFHKLSLTKHNALTFLFYEYFILFYSISPCIHKYSTEMDKFPSKGTTTLLNN